MSESFITKARPLYESYREWAEGAGEMAISETLFGKRLKNRGFVKEHRRYSAVYIGIGMRAKENRSGKRRDGFSGCDGL